MMTKQSAFELYPTKEEQRLQAVSKSERSWMEKEKIKSTYKEFLFW